MGRILDHYEYTQTMELLTEAEKGSLSLKMAVNAGVINKDWSTIEEFLQVKDEERKNA